MSLYTLLGALTFILGYSSSLFLIGAGLWVYRCVKLPCLPCILACWGFNFPLLVQLNSWCLNYLLGPRYAVSLSGIGLFAKRSAMSEFISWHNFLSATCFFSIVLLVVSDATLLVSQLKTISNDTAPRPLWLVRRFSPTFGFFALTLAVANHLLSLLITRIEP